ncbi:MAG: sensor domain-containing diguanylate cyclase [Armatimonadota bacterium]|nr:sensor domain-containing diguanylate cyclase [Armatimonadota bacterium]MCX7776959.1 sensor domain-containing diguanylate cyclase [Armatimonadota bacterium]MDW8024793.1 sensor domain-containing diguanylate cyclase [Armatimonadota bacterium]
MGSILVERLKVLSMVLLGSAMCASVGALSGGAFGITMCALSAAMALATALFLWFYGEVVEKRLERFQSEIAETRTIIADLRQEVKELGELTVQLQRLTEVLKSVAAAPDAEGVAKTLLDEVIQMFGAETGHVFMVSDDGQHLEEIALHPYNATRPQRRYLLKSDQDSIVARVALTGEPFILSPPTNGVKSNATSLSLMCVPLTSTRGVQGVLLIEDKRRRFTKSDLRSLELLAQQAAIALERARLYEQMERLSLTDALTGVANRRHLEKHLKMELARARRYNYPLTAIMLDIDHFKKFNDVHGHLTGDRVLQELAKLLTNVARASDLVGRYGGEEFLIICAYTDLNGALALAERIRAMVEQTAFESHEGEKLHITISAGVAAFPEDAQDEMELIEAADRALYEAKQTGRNRVCAYRDVSNRQNQ